MSPTGIERAILLNQIITMQTLAEMNYDGLTADNQQPDMIRRIKSLNDRISATMEIIE